MCTTLWCLDLVCVCVGVWVGGRVYRGILIHLIPGVRVFIPLTESSKNSFFSSFFQTIQQFSKFQKLIKKWYDMWILIKDNEIKLNLGFVWSCTGNFWTQKSWQPVMSGSWVWSTRIVFNTWTSVLRASKTRPCYTFLRFIIFSKYYKM